jgi:hypothetical protein
MWVGKVTNNKLSRCYIKPTVWHCTNSLPNKDHQYRRNNHHLVYTPISQTIPINCPSKSSEKCLQRGVYKFQLDPGCKMSLRHHYVFADKSIAMDSGLEHISLPRESQLRIPHISATDLKHHLQTMRMLNPYLYPSTQKKQHKKKKKKTMRMQDNIDQLAMILWKPNNKVKY